MHAVTRYMKRQGQVWIRIFPSKPITKSLLRSEWVKVKVPWNIGGHATVTPGRIMFEIDGVDFDTAKEALRLEPRNFQSQLSL